MALLQKAVNEQAFLKAGFLGFPGSGKSFTASALAMSIAEQFGDKKPVAFFDTEAGSDFLIPKFEAAGIELLRVKSKAFSDLLATGKEAESGGCSVLIVDSITHVWNELCTAFLNRINGYRKQKNRPALKKLEFQHWSEVKGAWADWTTFYLNSRLHIIVCGRAGYEYEFVANDDTEKKELQKVGTKMRVEGEFGFEPSLLVEMERASKGATPGAGWIHRAHILKDRTDSINGRAFDFGVAKRKPSDPEWKAVYEAFKPVIGHLNIGGAHSSVDTTRNSEQMFDAENGDNENTRRARRVTIALEEIQGTLVALWPGQDAASKRMKQLAVEELFATRSWAKVESQSLENLEEQLRVLRCAEFHMEDTDEAGAKVFEATPEGMAKLIREARTELLQPPLPPVDPAVVVAQQEAGL